MKAKRNSIKLGKRGTVVLLVCLVFFMSFPAIEGRGDERVEYPVGGIAPERYPNIWGDGSTDIPLRGCCGGNYSQDFKISTEHPLRGVVWERPSIHFFHSLTHKIMQVTLKKNPSKNGIEFHFSQALSKSEIFRLTALGLTKKKDPPNTWWARNHPAYEKFAEDLQTALAKKESLVDIEVQPSFEPSKENIDHNKFSYATISYRKGDRTQHDNYVIFDSYRAISQSIAEQFGFKTYGKNFVRADVQARRYKAKARLLLDEGKVITEERLQKPNEKIAKPKTIKTEKAARKKGKSLREKLTQEEFISFGIIGFDKLSAYKSSVVRKAHQVMEEAIGLGYAVPFDYGRGKGKYTTTQAAEALSYAVIFTNVYRGVHVNDIPQAIQPAPKDSKEKSDKKNTRKEPEHPFRLKEDIPKQKLKQCADKNEKGQEVTFNCVNVMILGNGYQGWNYTPFLAVQVLFNQVGHPIYRFAQRLEKVTGQDWTWLKDDLSQEPDLVTKKTTH